jgi:hypothetical protein
MKTNIYNQEVQDIRKLIDNLSDGEYTENTRLKIAIAWGKITAQVDLSDADTYYRTIKEFEQYVIEIY